MDTAVVIVGGMGLVGTVAGAVLAYFAASKGAKGTVQSAINDGFGKYMAAAEAREATMQGHISKLETMIRDLSAHIVDLEDAISKHGMPVPVRKFAHHLIALEGGKT